MPAQSPYRLSQCRNPKAAWLLVAVFVLHLTSSLSLAVHESSHHHEHHNEVKTSACKHVGHAADHAEEKSVAFGVVAQADADSHCFFCSIDWFAPFPILLEDSSEWTFGVRNLLSAFGSSGITQELFNGLRGRAPPRR